VLAKTLCMFSLIVDIVVLIAVVIDFLVYN